MADTSGAARPRLPLGSAPPGLPRPPRPRLGLDLRGDTQRGGAFPRGGARRLRFCRPLSWLGLEWLLETPGPPFSYPRAIWTLAQGRLEGRGGRVSGDPRAAASPSSALTAQEGSGAGQAPGCGVPGRGLWGPRRGQESLASLGRCNKEPSLRSAPVCVLSVSVVRALAARLCALLLTWPGAAPSLAGQPMEPSLNTAVLAESRCCVPAGAHPGLPCCTCPRVARSCGQGCVLWVKSPGVLDPRSPCGVPSPHWQQGPCSGATVGQRWVSWPAGTEALLQGPLWTGQHHLAGCRIAGGWCEQPWSWSSPLWAETRGSRRALCLLRLLIVVMRPTPIPCQP